MISSYSGRQGNCIDVSWTNESIKNSILIQETDLGIDPEAGLVETNKENFAAFIRGVKAGEFDHFVSEHDEVDA